jgi:ribosomal protein S27E
MKAEIYAAIRATKALSSGSLTARKVRKQTYDLIIKMLTKQISQKMIGLEIKYCPKCNEQKVFEEIGKVAFCPMCGQALKWNDDK